MTVPFRKGMTHEEWLEANGRIDKTTGEVLPPTGNEPHVMRNDLVKPPTAKQIRMYTCMRARVCGNCKNFNKELGQKALFRDKQVAAIVHDYQWKTEYLGSDPREMGVCMERSTGGKGLMLTGPTHSGAECEYYRFDPDKAR